MLETCEWLHKVLAPLPVVAYPFDLKRLPRNGIYFLYEQGEACGHHGPGPRIVRVGTHKEGNFRSRISEHFLPDERKMDFDVTRPRIWEVDMTPSANRATWRSRRDIDKEKQIEAEVTRIL